jgi:hypothetical protein
MDISGAAGSVIGMLGGFKVASAGVGALTTKTAIGKGVAAKTALVGNKLTGVASKVKFGAGIVKYGSKLVSPATI